MSEYGLLVKNNNGQIQIDSTYKNYVLYEHGESVTTASSSPANYYIATVTFANPTPYVPLIAIKPSSSDYCGLSYLTKSGSNYTGFVIHSKTNVAVTIDWMAFVPNETKSSEDYGLRVYDATGSLIIDNGYNPMVILDVDTATPAYSAVETITHPSDANAYFIMSPWGRWDILTSGPWPPGSLLTKYFGMLKYISATQVSFGGVLAGGTYLPISQSGSGGYWPTTWTILTIKKAF